MVQNKDIPSIAGFKIEKILQRLGLVGSRICPKIALMMVYAFGNGQLIF